MKKLYWFIVAIVYLQSILHAQMRPDFVKKNITSQVDCYQNATQSARASLLQKKAQSEQELVHKKNLYVQAYSHYDTACTRELPTLTLATIMNNVDFNTLSQAQQEHYRDIVAAQCKIANFNAMAFDQQCTYLSSRFQYVDQYTPSYFIKNLHEQLALQQQFFVRSCDFLRSQKWFVAAILQPIWQPYLQAKQHAITNQKQLVGQLVHQENMLHVIDELRARYVSLSQDTLCHKALQSKVNQEIITVFRAHKKAVKKQKIQASKKNKRDQDQIDDGVQKKEIVCMSREDASMKNYIHAEQAMVSAENVSAQEVTTVTNEPAVQQEESLLADSFNDIKHDASDEIVDAILKNKKTTKNKKNRSSKNKSQNKSPKSLQEESTEEDEPYSAEQREIDRACSTDTLCTQLAHQSSTVCNTPSIDELIAHYNARQVFFQTGQLINTVSKSAAYEKFLAEKEKYSLVGDCGYQKLLNNCNKDTSPADIKAYGSSVKKLLELYVDSVCQDTMLSPEKMEQWRGAVQICLTYDRILKETGVCMTWYMSLYQDMYKKTLPRFDALFEKYKDYTDVMMHTACQNTKNLESKVKILLQDIVCLKKEALKNNNDNTVTIEDRKAKLKSARDELAKFEKITQELEIIHYMKMLQGSGGILNIDRLVAPQDFSVGQQRNLKDIIKDIISDYQLHSIDQCIKDKDNDTMRKILIDFLHALRVSPENSDFIARESSINIYPLAKGYYNHEIDIDNLKHSLHVSLLDHFEGTAETDVQCKAAQLTELQIALIMHVTDMMKK